MAGKVHVVELGESVESIAYAHQLFWREIWDHPENAALKALRKTPHVLAPGDRVFVPEPQPKEVSVETGKRHTFRRRGVPSRLHLVMKANGEPQADVPYVLEIDGKKIQGRTGADGAILHWAAPDAQKARLRIGAGHNARVIELKLRHLQPITTLAGAQSRLRNLGFYQGPSDGEMTPQLQAAIRRFQEAHGLPVSGELDQATLSRIEKVYSR
jgi:hypothetical protein